MEDRDETPPETEPGAAAPSDDTADAPLRYTRREALAAMSKYAVSVGGGAATIVTADGLVSAASAYPPWLANLCRRHPDHWICTWDGWDRWDTFGRRNNNGRIRF